MEYEPHRYSHGPSLGIHTIQPSTHYYLHARNAPLAMSHASRVDPRGLGGPIGGQRSRGNMGLDEGTTESGQTRRRIAVACARCRKRKIRCSGDPGNGTGCQNCRSSGIDLNQCQFHRVGSQNAADVITNLNVAQGLASMANSNNMIPIYNAVSSAIYPRALPAGHYPHINTKSVFPQAWTIPYPEETSPVEAYGLDSSNAYLPNQNTVPNLYGDSYRWNHANQKVLYSGSNPYLEQEASVHSSYTPACLPYPSASNIRATVKTESLSPLSMTSLQSTLPITLPERPHPRQVQISESAAPQRQLPMPQPNPASTSRNAVDQLQDQRLRPAPVVNGSSHSATGAYTPKASMVWNVDGARSDVQGAASGETTSTELSEQLSPPKDYTSSASAAEGAMGYVPVTTSVHNETSSATSTPQQQISFSAAPLFESMVAPTPSATYSNFRNYTLPTSSSTDALAMLARQPSQTSFYSFSTDNDAKRNSLSDASSEATLVSGQRYAPLGLPQPQNAGNMNGLRRNSFETRVPIHHVSMSNLNRSY
ncbi:uncharacterized protein BDR25DRAFT_286461 [Lindgomyces ingoldianus]|uniref:Uncharacterized protein n=1 Tax=Lindgomyces ingoldianus TaxID=673940 RepID=A0ACB6QVL9_9PLEO|nr:uncharacterized protein BDR25DRAFT_286461 [Lindgomyces ingoldianus]KAF2471059.1 hypothetical protein BDR25DRAFT_286461 [Lindgomyces ingoldianus]